MSKGQRDRGASQSTDPADDAEQPSWKALWPFLVALAVVVVAAAGIGISYLIRPAEDRMSEEARVQHAVNDQYTARNDLDYAKYRASTCATTVSSATFPTEAVFLDENRKSSEQNGHIVIPEITDITVDGDRATAKVHWHFDDKPDDEQTTGVVVVREDGDWKVCTS
ncbi:hypothetical protein AAFP35_23910 [Gordonia sp. CPCC 206044]|uniref:Rv0361 family membrane protein n=1 Tax=Gordonia sp. CPCC 206044 TaxID=3140793 RepID=UPI003AF3EA7F